MAELWMAASIPAKWPLDAIRVCARGRVRRPGSARVLFLILYRNRMQSNTSPSEVSHRSKDFSRWAYADYMGKIAHAANIENDVEMGNSYGRLWGKKGPSGRRADAHYCAKTPGRSRGAIDFQNGPISRIICAVTWMSSG